ncbi:MAG: DUF434 domain-containing protein [Ignisphaera sp.]|uniref:DUF434 domain-containing protein n=1 Tax=Ignisphaera aggregans TaxID=334771 RepID=A0A7C4NKC3_9CREN
MENSKITDKVIEAAYDYKYLLSRGYPINASLDLVVSRYMLSKRERLLLFRCIHSSKYVKEIGGKLVCMKLNGYTLILDFYNVVISTINMLRGGEVYLCDDCVPRDLRGSKLHNDDYAYMPKALKIVTQVIEALKPKQVVAVVDRDVSHSYEHAFSLYIELKSVGINYLFELTSSPDSKIIDYSKNDYGYVVASTDSLIMMRSLRVIPLTFYIMNILKINPVYNFAWIFSSECPVCSDKFV